MQETAVTGIKLVYCTKLNKPAWSIFHLEHMDSCMHVVPIQANKIHLSYMKTYLDVHPQGLTNMLSAISTSENICKAFCPNKLQKQQFERQLSGCLTTHFHHKDDYNRNTVTVKVCFAPRLLYSDRTPENEDLTNWKGTIWSTHHSCHFRLTTGLSFLVKMRQFLF